MSEQQYNWKWNGPAHLLLCTGETIDTCCARLRRSRCMGLGKPVASFGWFLFDAQDQPVLLKSVIDDQPYQPWRPDKRSAQAIAVSWARGELKP